MERCIWDTHLKKQVTNGMHWVRNVPFFAFNYEQTLHLMSKHGRKIRPMWCIFESCVDLNKNLPECLMIF